MYGSYSDNPQSNPQITALADFQVLLRPGRRLALPAFRHGQLMVQSGCGLALIDEKIALAPNLTTRPIAGARWTADTAFVHHAGADHIALSILERHLPKVKRTANRKLAVPQHVLKPVQLELMA